MDTNSWLRLNAQDPRYRLPETLRAKDPRGARDCGWVEQMTPFIQHYAKPGEWVIDPFCGFGSTLVAAAIAGNPALGIELDADRVLLSRARLDAMGLDARDYPVRQGNMATPATQARCREAQPGFGLCLTNVPYFGCDAGDQADTAQLYQTRHYEVYLQRLRDVFNGVHEVLAPGGWCIVMAQNLRLGARFVPLAWDVARLLGERFVLHEERVLIYDRDRDTARLGPGGVSATNRAHEYALVCRKQPFGLDVAAGLALLHGLEQDGFDFVLYGSFADHLLAAGVAAATDGCGNGALDAPTETPPLPNDIDLIVPPDDAEVSRLMRWLEQHGFRIESWNAQVHPPVSVAALAYRHYFRARRLDQAGNALQVDMAVADTRTAFEAQRTKRCSTTSLPHWLPGSSSASAKPASS